MNILTTDSNVTILLRSKSTVPYCLLCNTQSTTVCGEPFMNTLILIYSFVQRFVVLPRDNTTVAPTVWTSWLQTLMFNSSAQQVHCSLLPVMQHSQHHCPRRAFYEHFDLDL